MVGLVDDKGVPVTVNTLDNKDKTFRVEFVATTVGVYTASVSFANQPVPNSPFKVTVESAADASKVRVYGPAVEKEVTVHQSTYFIVDCKDAGPGVLGSFMATLSVHFHNLYLLPSPVMQVAVEILARGNFHCTDFLNLGL